jgi:hypothetical protein
LGNSCIVIGEFGSLDDAASAIESELSDEFSIAKATYKGSGKKFFQSIAQQFEIPTTCPKLNADGEEIGEKPMTLDELKEEIALNIPADALLILPEAKRLTTLITFWLEDLNCRICCFAVAKPSRDIFLKMIEIELALPDDRAIREAMQDEAAKMGYNLTAARLSQLQPLAGRNPMLARKVVRQEKLGINQAVEHRQYVVVMPVILAALFSFAILRYVGMGIGNKNWQIFGGVALTVAMAAKQLGRVEGAKKKLGQ